jgi:CheY-like chemotaxis protein
MHEAFSILLIEDSDEDVFLFRRALGKTGRPIAVNHVRNGIQAQEYLQGEGEFADRARHPFPRLVFSDLSLPIISGMEFLQWLRADPRFRGLPCIIFSGSANPAEVQTAYNNGVTSFLVKPARFQEWVSRLETVLKFWMEIAQAPVLGE